DRLASGDGDDDVDRELLPHPDRHGGRLRPPRIARQAHLGLAARTCRCGSDVHRGSDARQVDGNAPAPSGTLRAGWEPGERGARPAEIQAFLIADIRGYTVYTDSHGDEAAGHLARRFADETLADPSLPLTVG